MVFSRITGWSDRVSTFSTIPEVALHFNSEPKKKERLWSTKYNLIALPKRNTKQFKRKSKSKPRKSKRREVSFPKSKTFSETKRKKKSNTSPKLFLSRKIHRSLSTLQMALLTVKMSLQNGKKCLMLLNWPKTILQIKMSWELSLRKLCLIRPKGKLNHSTIKISSRKFSRFKSKSKERRKISRMT